MNYTEKKKLISEILNCGVIEFPLPDDIIKFVESYINDHHCGIGNIKIDKLWLQKNPTFNHNNFYFNGLMDGAIVTKRIIGISNTAANKTEKTDDYRLTQAMRSALVDDLILIKRQMLNDIDACQLCGNYFDLKYTHLIHLDHKGPLEFRHIKEEFLSVGPNLQVMPRESNDDGLTKLVDNEDSRLWVEFHHSRARFQLLCQHCNLSKGKK